MSPYLCVDDGSYHWPFVPRGSKFGMAFCSEGPVELTLESLIPLALPRMCGKTGNSRGRFGGYNTEGVNHTVYYCELMF